MELIPFGNYKSGNTRRGTRFFKIENSNRKMQIGKYQTEHTNRKDTNQKNTNWRNTNREIQVNKIQLGRIQIAKYTSENASRQIQVRKYKSETTTRKT